VFETQFAFVVLYILLNWQICGIYYFKR